MKFDGPLLDQRWRLGPRMGAGAQAATFLARDEKAKGERVVVLKQLQLKSSGWKKFDLFEREARVLETLRHPGIPRFLASFESEPGVFNLVMERMRGASLRAIATRVSFTDDDLRDILSRVLDILDYIHHVSPPVIHRDIKPANLVRDAKGNVALVDFGGVRDALREGGGSTVIGTFGYMAPEQLHGQATPATDIYGLGATIVALAGGVEPEQVPRRGLRMDLQKHLAGRDPGLIEVLEAMTDPDPDQRPQSARQVSKRLAKSMARSKKAKLRRARGLPAPATTAKPTKSASRRKIEDELALQRLESGEPKPFEELAELPAAVPAPFDLVVRILLMAFAVGGYVAVTVVQAVLVPIIFGAIGVFADKKDRPKLDATRRDVRAGLISGRDGLRSLGRRMRDGGNDPPKQLRE
ncbi:serine/threonine-protein kinase [Haliangium sp.]|uniref:serine/threonine-protein kinase n=1 Tax=Haliangium sp. TaxID=2663208 RepID=UPI003D12056D